MILSQRGLIETLRAGGVNPSALNPFLTRLNGNNFSTVSKEWVAEVFEEVMKGLERNAPALVEVLDLGNGRSRRVPVYVSNGFCCRGHGLAVYAHGMLGFAVKGVVAMANGAPLPEDALAFGVLEFIAEPRADNRHREGPHQQVWFIDHDGRFQTFEPGDGEENEFTPGELDSICFIYAQ